MYNSLKIQIPNIETQKQIGNHLYSLETRIKNLNNQIESLEKNSMNDFNKAQRVIMESGEELKEYTLSEISTITTGDSLTTYKGQHPSNSIKYFRGRDVFNAEKLEYVLQEELKSNQLKKMLNGSETIIYNRATFYVVRLPKNSLTSNQGHIIEGNEKIVNLNYLFFYMLNKQNYIQKNIGKKSATVDMLLKSKLENMTLQLPSIDVQNRVGEFLARQRDLIRDLIRERNALTKLLELEIKLLVK